jgi:hypothetical protein
MPRAGPFELHHDEPLEHVDPAGISWTHHASCNTHPDARIGKRPTGDAGAIASVSGLRAALTPVRPPETPAEAGCRSAAILARGIVHPDRPLRPGRLRCERRTCQHPSNHGEELKRRKADKQHDQRAFNRQAALPSPFQAMKVVNRRGPGNGAGRHDIAPNTCRMGFAVSACGSLCTRSPYLRCVARRAKTYRLRRRAMAKLASG